MTRPLPPFWSFAAALVIGELATSLAGAYSVALAGLALVAPGWAFAPLLPQPLRERPLAAFAACPALGAAIASVTLITLARIGVRLDRVSVFIALIVLVIAALPTWTERDRVRLTLAGAVELLALVAVLGLGLVLARRVIGSGVPPGNDWAKYLLYADQVRAHGALLIRNPFWMLGQPFRDDPGVPALYGAALILSRAAAGALAHGILVFTSLLGLTVYAFARARWGRVAGLLAAALVLVVPASQDILGWYGLANLAALVLLALLFCYLGSFAEGGLDRRSLVGMALTLLGLLASHRLSGVVGLAACGLVALACCVGRARRRRALRDAMALVLIAAIGGAGVLADLVSRERTFGGSLPYTDYLDTKLNLTLALRDVSPMLAIATAVALVLVATRHRRDGALWGPLALLAVSAALAVAWIVHIPNYYARMVFYAPVAAAPLVAAAAVSIRPRALVAAAAAAGIALTASSSWSEAANVRNYYTFVTPAALRGLDALSAVLRPGEVVVTDRCWSFLATWLLHTRTLAALEPQDIQPAAELPFAREAQQIIAGTPAGLARARALGVRYLVVDPVCPGPSGAALPPPGAGRPVFESARLAILRLPTSTARRR